MINLKNISEQSGIYKITNKINNKVYIGQAINLRKRIKNHIGNYKLNKKNKHFYSSIQKYAIENFELEILVQGNFTKQELDELEIDFIRLFNSTNQKFGYNLTIGGEGTRGLKHSEEVKYKQRQIKLGKKASPETRKKISEVGKDRKHSEETKQKISKSNKCKIVSKETREKMSKSGKGKIITEQHIEKIKDTKRKNGTLNKTGYKHSQESIDKIKQTKIKNGTLNFITSEETKKKISEKLKGRVSPRKGKPAPNKGVKSKPESIQKMLKTKEFNRNMKLIKENNFVYDWLF